MKTEIKSQDIDKTIDEVNEVEEIGEIDYELVASGPLRIDPRYLEDGYIYEFVSDEPGLIGNKQKLGYVIIQDTFNVGDNVASKSSRFGSAVTVQSKCGRLLVLMRISEKLHAQFMAWRDSKQKLKEKALRRAKIEGVSEDMQELNGQPLGEYKQSLK
jgi:hypothetical protein